MVVRIQRPPAILAARVSTVDGSRPRRTPQVSLVLAVLALLLAPIAVASAARKEPPITVPDEPRVLSYFLQ
jgi:hypothetical protein